MQPRDDSGTSGDGIKTIPEARQLTKARARDFGSLLLRYAERHLPPLPERTGTGHPPPRVTGTHALALRYLRLIPVFLTVLFCVSLVWDFDGIGFSVLGYAFNLEGLLRLSSVSGMIGFLTNWLAITMLFRPRKRRPVFGQGLIPAQRERVIYRLAQAVSTELINEEIIQEKIQESGVIGRYREIGLEVTRGVLEDEDFRRDFRSMAVDYVQSIIGSEDVRTRLARLAAEKLEQHAGEGISGLALRLYRYFNEADFQVRIEKVISDIPNAVDSILDSSDRFLDTIPDRIESRAEDIERWASKTVLTFVGQLDIYGMIRDRMEKYDESRLEQLLKTSSNEQLNYIKYLGGVLGFFGGLVIWEPVPALAAFLLIGGSLAGIDALLYRRKKE